MLYLRMASQNTLRVMSYNCQGINIVKTEYINSLLSMCEIFLYKSTGSAMHRFSHYRHLTRIFLLVVYVGLTHKLFYKGELLVVVPFCGVKSCVLMCV